MILKQKTIKLDIKAIGEDGEFEGYGSVFDVEDSYGDVVIKGAFKKSLEKHKANGTMPKMLWQHRSDEPVGGYAEIYEDDYGLFLKGKLLIKDDPLAARAYAHLKEGNIDGLSIGYVILDSEYDEDNKVLKLTEIDLWEISIVTFQANAEATVTDVKTRRDLEEFFRTAGCCSRKDAKKLASNFDPIGQRDVARSIKELRATIRS